MANDAHEPNNNKKPDVMQLSVVLRWRWTTVSSLHRWGLVFGKWALDEEKKKLFGGGDKCWRWTHFKETHTAQPNFCVCVCFAPKHTSESTVWVYKQQQHHPCYKRDDRRRRLRDRRQRRNYFIPQRLNLSECLVPGISSHCFILTVSFILSLSFLIVVWPSVNVLFTIKNR